MPAHNYLRRRSNSAKKKKFLPLHKLLRAILSTSAWRKKVNPQEKTLRNNHSSVPPTYFLADKTEPKTKTTQKVWVLITSWNISLSLEISLRSWKKITHPTHVLSWGTLKLLGCSFSHRTLYHEVGLKRMTILSLCYVIACVMKFMQH